MLKNIKKIFAILEKDKKKQFKILVILMFFSMLLETIGISSMIPLINYFTGESILLPYNIDLNSILTKFGFSEKNVLNFILIFIITIFLIKNIYLSLYSWLESKFAYKVRFDLGVRLFKNYLYSPYLFHLKNNSSNLIAKILQESAIYGAALINLSTLITEMLIVIGLVTFLLIIKPVETLAVIVIGFISSSIFYFGLKNTISRLGLKREKATKENIKSLQQGLGAIKDIIFYEVQKNFINIFTSKSNDVAEVGFKMHFLQKLPKMWFEIISILVMTFVIFFLSQAKMETSSIIATAGIFLLVFIRIVPSINRILTALQNIKFSEASFDSLLTDLESSNSKQIKINQQKEISEKTKFQKEIKFKNVFFKYEKSDEPVLKNVNLTIKKNEFVGIIGETGAGKSTFVDLLIGLIEPSEGEITADGKNIREHLYSWTKNLGYVPQNFYLLDESIKNNIAFGYEENKISTPIVKSTIDKSQLSNFIKNLKDGLESRVGERGVKISGGEKQRIGIARALYNDPDILVFDEATSALDLDTEKKILETLIQFKKVKTVIIITHRKSSLNICDRVFKIENNKINEIKK